MKSITASVLVAVAALAGPGVAAAADLKDSLKVEVQHVGLQTGMDPGLYVCAAGHLHIKGTVQNLSGVSVSRVKVAGQAFNADGKLLGSASSSIRVPLLRPNEKAEVNLEFLDIIGPTVDQVKNYQLTVVDAQRSP